MPRIAIVENTNGALLALDTQLLPEGVDARVVELSDTEAAELDQPGTYAVDESGVVTVTPPDTTAEDAAKALRQQILNVAQSAVGVALDQLTAGQRNALVACLLYRASGVTQDMRVRPLGEWVK